MKRDTFQALREFPGYVPICLAIWGCSNEADTTRPPGDSNRRISATQPTTPPAATPPAATPPAATPPAATRSVSQTPQPVIQGVFEVLRADIAKEGLRVWVFEPDGLITDYIFQEPTMVLVCDGSYRFKNRLEDGRYELVFDTDNDASARGTGVLTVMKSRDGARPVGFTFSVDGKEFNFHSASAGQLQDMLSKSQALDFRTNKNKAWEIINTERPNVVAALLDKNEQPAPKIKQPAP